METVTKVRSERLAELLKTVKPIPGFSCLAMTERAQQQILRDLDGLSAEEEAAYWKRQREKLTNGIEE